MNWFSLLFGPNGWGGLLLEGAVVTILLAVTSVPFGFGSGSRSPFSSSRRTALCAPSARPSRPSSGEFPIFSRCSSSISGCKR